MINDVFTISPRRRDLHPTKEFWVAESYADREKKIIDFINGQKGATPHANMKYIREVSFGIKKTTTMDQLRDLATHIHEECVIDCFQISISRQNNVAHMLFDWYDYKNKQCFYLYEAYQMAMSAMIIRKLKLPFPKNLDSKWLRYLLSREYSENNHIYREFIEELKHKHLSKRFFTLGQQMSTYIENVCKGIAK